MNTVIDIPLELLISLTNEAQATSSSIDEVILKRLSAQTDDREDFEDDALNEKVQELLTFSHETFNLDDEPFTLQAIYEGRYGKSAWQQTSDSSRKKLGRRFKAIVEEALAQAKNTSSDQPTRELRVFGKTNSGSTLYQMDKVPRRLVITS